MNGMTMKFIDNILADILRADYKGYSINSIPNLPFNNKVLGILWRQFFRISPINFRPLFRCKRSKNNKSIILLAQALRLLYEKTEDPKYFQEFSQCIDMIFKMKSSSSDFFSIRQGKTLYLKNYKATDDDTSPLLTAWSGILFLDCAQSSNKRIQDHYDWQKHVFSVADYLTQDLPRESFATGIYFCYSPGMKKRIFNASAEISSFLCRVGHHYRNDRIFSLGKNGLFYVIEKQNHDGSWFYGDEKPNLYIDNFHTAFILTSLATVIPLLTDQSKVSLAFEKGLLYYKTQLLRDADSVISPRHFDPAYIPLNSNALQKIDLRDIVVSIELFQKLGDYRLVKELRDVLYNKFVRSPKIICEYTWLWKNRISYIDFQAWGLLGLAHCVEDKK